MIQKQIDSFNMYMAVLNYLDNNSVNWNSNLIISKAVKAFRSAVFLIEETSNEQEITNKKISVNKEQDRERLINLVYRLALRVKNYAVGIKDFSLKRDVDFSRNEIEAGKESDIIKRCKSILARAKGLINVPGEYKIKPELIQQVSAALDTLETHNKLGNIAKEGFEVVREKTDLESLFNTARAKLHILDDLIEGDADDNTNVFVRKYFTTRRTINLKADETNKPGNNVNESSSDFF